VLSTAAINAPRFDYNPSTLAPLGLLIEQSSTNLLTYSQDFSNAIWANQNVTVNTTANIAPDGTQTFNKIQENSTSNLQFYVKQSYTFALGVHTFYFYAKASERNWVYFEVGNSYANINLLTGALGTTGIFSTGWTFGSASATPVGNGVYRCQITSTCTIAGSYLATIHVENANNSIVYTGTIGYGLYAWGSQLEALAFPTSYIPTTSAQVTRASDNASMTGTNFSSWYNSAQGTFYLNGTTIWTTTNIPTSTFISLTYGTNNSSVYTPLYVNAGSNNLYCYDNASATGFSSPGFGSKMQITVNYGSSKSIFANGFAGNGANTTYNGAFGLSTGVIIGSGGGYAFNGRIAKISYYPSQLTSTQQISLTGS
jgi:hypothetical protein